MKVTYTVKNIILDVDDRRLHYLDEIYVGNTPKEVLEHAMSDNKDFLGKFVGEDHHHGYSHFILDNDNSGYQCAIIKKGPKLKYVPFESMHEFISAYYKANNEIIVSTESMLSCFGMWLKCFEHYELVTYIHDKGIEIDYISINWNTLFDSYTFLDGSPCGKEVKDE